MLWDDVTVGAGCVVTDCVLADGVRLENGTVLDRQAVVRLPPTWSETTALPGATRDGDLLMVPI